MKSNNNDLRIAAVSGTPAAGEAHAGFGDRNPLLDPLRGIACMWVLLFHYQFSPSFQKHLPGLHGFFKLGDLGVAMFFVISGFCLALAAERSRQKQESPIRFLGRRAWRIFPTFWLSIAAILLLRYCVITAIPLLGGAANPFVQIPSYSAGGWIRVFTLTKQLSLSPTFFWERFAGINGAYWSLAIEFQFYLLMSSALWLPRYFRPVLVGVTLLALPLSFNSERFFQVAQTGACLAHWPWFACGIAVYWACERDWTPHALFGKKAEPIAFTFTVAFATVMAYSAVQETRPDRFVFSLAFAAFLWLGNVWSGSLAALQNQPTSRLRPLYNLLSFVGLMSYSLYLVHNEIWTGLQHLLRSFHGHEGLLTDVLIPAVAVGGGMLFFVCCERPFLQRKKSLIATSTAPVTSDQPHGDADRAIAA